MRVFEGFQHGVNLGGWLSQCVATTEEHFDSFITEADIAILLQAKGVIYAGIQIALKHLGKRLEDLDTIYLAGGFARHIDLPDAVALGLLPDVPLERFRFIGNGSLAGAYLRLIDTTFAGAMARVAARPEVIELNLDPEFEDAYMMAMFLP